jgi:hypothetical protein
MTSPPSKKKSKTMGCINPKHSVDGERGQMVADIAFPSASA